MINCPNCGAPLRNMRCLDCGTETVSASLRMTEEIIDGDTTYNIEKASPVIYPVIGKLNGKPVIRALHPFQVPENPEYGTILVNDSDVAYVFRESGWERFPLMNLIRNERLFVYV